MNDKKHIQKTNQQEDELPQYIAEAIQVIGSVRKLASIAGVSERSVYAWKNGERFPSRNNINKISEYLENLTNKNYHIETPSPLRSLRECLAKPFQSGSHESSSSMAKRTQHDFLSQSQVYIANIEDQKSQTRGKTTPWLGQGHDFQRRSNIENSNFVEEFVFIEKAEAKPSAGGGSLETSTKCENTYAFRLDWILQKTHSSKGLRIMEVAGRSMENTLHNGDLVLVDEQDKRLVEDRIYVLRVHDEIYIKRFSKTPGYYHFRGDNRELAYQDITINLHTEDLDWCIIGRTIWAGKEL